MRKNLVSTSVCGTVTFRYFILEQNETVQTNFKASKQGSLLHQLKVVSLCPFIVIENAIFAQNCSYENITKKATREFSYGNILYQYCSCLKIYLVLVFLNSGILRGVIYYPLKKKKKSLWMHMSQDQILLLFHQQESDPSSCKLKLVSTQKKKNPKKPPKNQPNKKNQ